VLLRTHTSTVQVREMLSHPPPVQVVCPGAVYRRDDDVDPQPDVLSDRGAHGRRAHHDDRSSAARSRPSSGGSSSARCEDALPRELLPLRRARRRDGRGCLICDGQNPACRVCKGTGWLEMLGCGMVHPTVFESVGYDPERYTGFAFGMGIDRLAMLRYQVSDIRLLYENDVRFLSSL
jgi:phenylalanyl-tRNA synthetase alpha chain